MKEWLLDVLARFGLLPDVRRVKRHEPVPMRCPSCRRGVPRYVDLEEVRCPLCGWVTDLYEAMKAAEQAGV